jgi:hypothetical protein
MSLFKLIPHSFCLPTSRDLTESEASENTASPEDSAVDSISASVPASLTTTGKTSGITHDEMITPVLPLWPSKNTNFKSPPDCWWSEVLDMEIKGYVDLSDKTGNNVLCLLCQDGKGKSDGVIALHRPFSKYYWDVHEKGDKHKNLLKQGRGEEELIAKGKMKEKRTSHNFLDSFSLQVWYTSTWIKNS